VVLNGDVGKESHAAIIARKLGIPIVVVSDPAIKQVTDGSQITVDANRGIVSFAETVITAKPATLATKENPVVVEVRPNGPEIDVYISLNIKGIPLSTTISCTPEVLATRLTHDCVFRIHKMRF